MLASNIFRLKPESIDLLEEDNEKRVMVHVHDIKPPFLDGKVVYTT